MTNPNSRVSHYDILQQNNHTFTLELPIWRKILGVGHTQKLGVGPEMHVLETLSDSPAFERVTFHVFTAGKIIPGDLAEKLKYIGSYSVNGFFSHVFENLASNEWAGHKKIGDSERGQ